ncbi:MAG: histidinol-phosphatase [Planctomycetes bacterium]|nr:histidinol-phosphatase [Planctomycetota bacterium]
MNKTPTVLIMLLTFGLGIWMACAKPESQLDSTTPFWKGNTHTHSLWSDGDAAPEWIADWYKEQNYNFLVLSDHNILSTGNKWFPVKDKTRLTPQRLAALQTQFGADLVQTRVEGDGTESMKLKTLPELRARFEEIGQFIFLQGEEITDGFDKANIHINAFPLSELIRPQKGASIQETLQRNFDAVHQLAQDTGKGIIAHLNHPNFTWSLTWQDFAAIQHEQFFEVYNGHNSVRNYGDAERESTERMWDLVNTARLREHGLPLLFGLATDDSHHYHDWGENHPNPGRGWVQVRAATLEPEALVSAMQQGDFYASTGVEINYSSTGDAIQLAIQPKPGVTYRTEFIGTRGEEIGVVLQTSSELTPKYSLIGDELFVRARITSSKLHANPFAEGDFEMAWLQPIQGGGK